MALETELDSLDGLSEKTKSLYTERDGKFYFDEDKIPDDGWKTKVHQLNKESEKHRKEAEELAARLSGIDAEEYKALKEKAIKAEEERKKAEEDKLLSENRFEELANKRVESLAAEHKRKLTEKDNELEELKKTVESSKARALDDQIRAAIGSKVHEKAQKDALRAAREIFRLDENGNAVRYDENGDVKYGTDAKRPQTPDNWISSEETKDENPHWYAASLGGTGATQTNGSGGGKTMSRATFMTLSPQNQAKIMRERSVKVVDK